MENVIKILVTLDYMVIKAIGGMEIRRVYSSLMAGTPSFEKQRDVRNGCTDRERWHPTLSLAVSGRSTDANSTNAVTVRNKPCYQLW